MVQCLENLLFDVDSNPGSKWIWFCKWSFVSDLIDRDYFPLNSSGFLHFYGEHDRSNHCFDRNSIQKKETKFECFLKIPDDERLLLNSISQSELSYIWIKRAFLESPSDCRSFSNLKISIQMLMRGPVITVPILFTFHLFAA